MSNGAHSKQYGEYGRGRNVSDPRPRPAPCRLRQAIAALRDMAADEHATCVRFLVAADGLEPAHGLELWLDAAAGAADRWAVCAPVHHPARLRARLVLRQQPGQPMLGRLPGPDHFVSVRLLEKDPRRAPRHFGEPGP